MPAGPEPSAPFAAALDRLHAALAKVANGDVTEIKALYAHTDDATSFYGWGGYEQGWSQVSRRWDWAAAQFKGGGPVRYQELTTVITAELAYTTAIETIRTRLDGLTEPTEWSNRVTHVFRREGGEWRLVHRHANRLEPQYQPGARLGKE
jgi:ketosteroid isomerase-like protein